MQLTNKIEWPAGGIDLKPVTKQSPVVEGAMEVRDRIAPTTRPGNAFSVWM